MNKTLVALCISATVFSFSSCSDDIGEEITTLNVSRTFSPTGLTATVVNKTGVRLVWKAVPNAKSYTIEVFENADFSGTPVKTVTGVPFEQQPYTISGLSGETQHYVRVKAVGEGIDDSKWVTASFTTDAEQIFQDIDPAKLTATSVTVNWPAGETATTITLSPGNISRAVTPAEIAAGQATISGLTGETTYTVKLMNGTKTRGTKTFTTLIDLGGAIAVNPTDDLAALITNAQGGEVFALMPGVYNINADVIVTKTISIKGVRPANKPVINGMVLKMRANAGLSLKDLVLNGTGAPTASQLVVYDQALNTAYGALSVQDSEIKNYRGLIYVNIKALIESVTYSGNIIHDIASNGGGFVDFRQGLAKTFLFENNTVYNVTEDGSRDLFRMDAGSEVTANFSGIPSVITIRTNTFYNALNRAAGRYLYIRLPLHQIHFTKNLIAESANYYSNQSTTTITTMANNNYYNAPNFTASTVGSAKNDLGPFTTLDPGFVSPSTGDFTVTNFDLKANGIGDPRWRR
ncbi:DUF4957 domain-containing protein [Pedobacter sp. SYSU D00535]|uniref:DUF4957 domain-containing protein n=1 Tax=Pedobacter sp. SYSU D00535 TaxID=2810308 RepID=UPI001F600C0C|nr:DUF4957 domain-containing protein [Pedobacter sp. SYSU D00535]